MNTTAWVSRIRTLVHCWMEDHYHSALPRVALIAAEQTALAACRRAARLPVVRVAHGGERIAYATIQAALDDAQAGERIEIPAGVFVEQLTIRQPVVLQGAGQGQTIVQSPQADALVQSGDQWVDAIARASFAIVAIRTERSGMVVIRDLTIDGRDQGYLPSYYALGQAACYSFQGVAAWDSDVTLEGVTITRINEFDSTQLAIQAGSSGLAENVPVRHAGMRHNESVFVESCTCRHTFTMQHATISGFQQSAVLAWGAHQRVHLSHNRFEGRFATYHTAAHVIQLGCDLPAYADLCGVGGVIRNNRVVDLGRSWPMVVVRQVRLGEACAVALFGVDECLLEDNELFRRDIAPWVVGALPDGCYAHHGIVIKGLFSGSLRDNVISGFEVAVSDNGQLCAKTRYRFLHSNHLQHNGQAWQVIDLDIKGAAHARHEQLLEMLSW